jgi:hypothetical protein
MTPIALDLLTFNRASNPKIGVPNQTGISVFRMLPSKKPTYFYLFPTDEGGVEIRAMTEQQAATVWHQGERWLDMPRETLREAQELRLVLLRSRTQRPK